MKLFDAIQKMRELSKDNIPFSISFMSHNSTTQTSDGVVRVRHARLRARPKEKHHSLSDIVEEYLNLDTGKPRRFYQLLLMEFNGQKIELT